MKQMIPIWILLLCVCAGKARAQNDPVLAGMIAAYTDKAQKELKNQEKVMLMQTTGHLWTKEEVEATTDLQRELNNYLDSFRSIVCYAAQIYGFYHEVSRLTDNMDDFTRQLGRSPTNALAVALSAQPDIQGAAARQRGDRERHPGGLSGGKQDDRARAHGDRLLRPPEAARDERDAVAADQGREVHHDVRHLVRDRRRRTPRGRQARHSGGGPKALAADREERKTLKKRRYGMGCDIESR